VASAEEWKPVQYRTTKRDVGFRLSKQMLNDLGHTQIIVENDSDSFSTAVNPFLTAWSAMNLRFRITT
jgi:hypothetical protein